jgi:hypothetical protein
LPCEDLGKATNRKVNLKPNNDLGATKKTSRKTKGQNKTKKREQSSEPRKQQRSQERREEWLTKEK